METPEQMSLDEIVAYNVRRLREERGWSVSTVANALEAGGFEVTKAAVYDMERPRKGRTQRQFLWTDLVALCGVFNTNLFELVLPPKGIEISDLRGLIIPDSDSPIGPDGYAERRIGRDGLSWRVFGVPGEHSTPAVLKKLAGKLAKEATDRLAMLEAAQEEANGND